MKIIVNGEQRDATPEEEAEILAGQQETKTEETNTNLREVPTTLFGGPTLQELFQ